MQAADTTLSAALPYLLVEGHFRVDRILEMKTTAREIEPDRARDLRAYLAAMGASPDFEV